MRCIVRLGPRLCSYAPPPTARRFLDYRPDLDDCGMFHLNSPPRRYRLFRPVRNSSLPVFHLPFYTLPPRLWAGLPPSRSSFYDSSCIANIFFFPPPRGCAPFASGELFVRRNLPSRILASTQSIQEATGGQISLPTYLSYARPEKGTSTFCHRRQHSTAESCSGAPLIIVSRSRASIVMRLAPPAWAAIFFFFSPRLVLRRVRALSFVSPLFIDSI